MRSYSIHIIFVLCMLPLVVSASLCAQDIPRNLPELSLPVSGKKLVIAHCMTNIIRYKGHAFEDGCNPRYYSPYNNITAPIGGMTQVHLPQDDFLKDASLEEAVEFEMRTAKKAGIDGFQFYYTLNDNGSDKIIRAYLKVATEKNIDFKFTFCISHPAGLTEDQKINAFSKRINIILDEAGRNNEHWLRTPDGRLIVYMWYGEQLADIPPGAPLPGSYYAARAFKKLGEAVQERFACIYSINEVISHEDLNSLLDYFPAVWMWTLPFKKNYAGYFVAATCKQRKRTFTGSAFPDFYTSKVLKPGTWTILNAEKAAAAGIHGSERKAIATGLSYNFRKMLEFNISQDVPIMNIITWNDYPEGHHLAPETNHNDGFTLLLQYYKSAWQKDTSAFPRKDMAAVFYKKYAHDIKPSPFDIHLVYVEKGAQKASGEDGIEVVTFLQQPATLLMNNETAEVPAGMFVTKFKQQTGTVNITVKRSGLEIIRFAAPEAITDKPLRTDRLTYSYSSETPAYYTGIFGSYQPLSSTQPTIHP